MAERFVPIPGFFAVERYGEVCICTDPTEVLVSGSGEPFALYRKITVPDEIVVSEDVSPEEVILIAGNIDMGWVYPDGTTGEYHGPAENAPHPFAEHFIRMFDPPPKDADDRTDPQ